MPQKEYNQYFNRYYGLEWVKAQLPQEPQIWIMGPYNKAVKKDNWSYKGIPSELKDHLQPDSWQWPKRVIYFFSDLHADKDAFIDSLVASGGIKKTGPKDKDFRLTKEGKKANFILGGDCFDKGPSTLRLLKTIKILIDKGADITILTGNHDLRTLIGNVSLLMKRTPANEHFFVRMGIKPMPLFKEIYDTYLSSGSKKESKKFKKILKGIPSTEKCRKKLFPSENWAENFAQIAKDNLSEQAIAKEIKRTNKKILSFEKWCEQHDLSLRQVYAAVKIWQKLFLHPKGEFYWFFKHIKMARKEGSFFFVHAGVDDLSAKMIRASGVKSINKQFSQKLKNDPFDLYYGPLGNMVRTKYRDTDRQFTSKGSLILRNAGINAIVHGHRNLYYGQRLMLRRGMVNFECDTSVDINTRKKEGVPGHGASVTIIRPEQMVLGISSDYPFVKVFEPNRFVSFKNAYRNKNGKKNLKTQIG